jgi:hypothetical protein
MEISGTSALVGRSLAVGLCIGTQGLHASYGLGDLVTAIREVSTQVAAFAWVLRQTQCRADGNFLLLF